jgi:flagellar hook protein FlgE
LANFNNPGGLERMGDTTFRSSPNSGLAQIGVAGTGGRGVMQSGILEMSNVDLGMEFTNLIIAQRGFQANSRVITSSDEMLQELVNIKR